MKIISWNVNGIRAAINKNFIEVTKKEKPDILCIQETKANSSQVDVKLLEKDYKYIYWNSAEKKGYSGTAIFSKIEPVNVFYDMDIDKHKGEGRIITLEFENYFLVNVYTPNSQRGLLRLEYREQWDKDFLNYIKILENKKSVIFCGDLNVAHKEIDLKNPKNNKTTKTRPGNAGFTNQERKGFDNILKEGFIDVFRYLYPNKIQYTWWSYMFNAREKNIGWRIDYFGVSKDIKTKVKDIKILDNILGSDHCPIKLIINI